MMIGLVTEEGGEGEEGGKSHCKVGTRWVRQRRHQGEELGLYITIRADENFVDLHCFVEGPKFWKIVPHLFDFLCCVYFDFIGQVRKCRKQIYFYNIVMVGHFTFGLCQRLQSGQEIVREAF